MPGNAAVLQDKQLSVGEKLLRIQPPSGTFFQLFCDENEQITRSLRLPKCTPISKIFFTRLCVPGPITVNLSMIFPVPSVRINLWGDSCSYTLYKFSANEANSHRHNKYYLPQQAHYQLQLNLSHC